MRIIDILNGDREPANHGRDRVKIITYVSKERLRNRKLGLEFPFEHV